MAHPAAEPDTSLAELVEVGRFRQEIEALMSEKEAFDLYTSIAKNPYQGALIKGTGGVRKLRWRGGGKGKRGGLRVIYYFHDEDMPTFLITAYGKSEKDDLSQAGKNAMKARIRELVSQYR